MSETSTSSLNCETFTGTKNVPKKCCTEEQNTRYTFDTFFRILVFSDNYTRYSYATFPDREVNSGQPN